MRRIWAIVLSILVIASLSLTCFAAGATLSLSGAEAEPGELVYLVASLSDTVMGNTMGVSYSYDEKVLEAVPASSSWEVSGVLQDFNENNSGVWASSSVVNLKGAVCILAFRIRPEASFTQTKVSCSVIVKNDNTEVGKFSAEAVVTKACAHDYGPWTDQGAVGHSRTCSKCKATQTGSHSWDEGVNSANMTVYTCSVCAGTKKVENESGSGEQKPEETMPTETVPHPTLPTKPTEPPAQKPTTPRETEPLGSNQNTSGNQGGNTGNSQNQGNSADHNHGGSPESEGTRGPAIKDYNKGMEATDSAENAEQEHTADEHDHDHGPEIIPAGTGSAGTKTTEHTHDHEDTAGQSSVSPWGAAAVVGVLILGVGLMVYFLRKKR